MPVGFVMMAFSLLIGIGSGSLVSIRLGQRKKEEAEHILGNALTLAVIASIVSTVVFMVLLVPLLTQFGASPATLPYGQQFLRVILLGSLFQYVSFGLNAIIRAEGNPRLAMLTMFINAGLNIALDAIFILGLGFGITGAAVATVISQAVSAIWTVAHFCSERSVLKLRLKNLRPRWQVLRPALAIGMAPFSMHLAASVISLIVNRGLARYGGDLAVSSYGIVGPIAMLFLMPVFGLNQGAQPIIGYNFGAGRVDRVRRTLKLAVLAATAVVCLGFVMAEAIPGVLVRAFVEDERVVALSVRGMRFWFAMLPVVGFQAVSANFFQAIGKARISLILTLLRQVIIFIPLLLILPPLIGLDGVWASGPISDAASSLLTAAALTYQLRLLKQQEADGAFRAVSPPGRVGPIAADSLAP
jgi:putative MATE family efflux protein